MQDLGRLWRRIKRGNRGTGDGVFSSTALKIVPVLNSGMHPVSSTIAGSNLGSNRLYIRFASTNRFVKSAALNSASLSGFDSSASNACRKAMALTYLRTLSVQITKYNRRHLHVHMAFRFSVAIPLQANLQVCFTAYAENFPTSFPGTRKPLQRSQFEPPLCL